MTGELDEAHQCLVSARALLGLGDVKGAINRAYYGMFYAARQALIAVDPRLANVKTHASVVRRFGEYIVLGESLQSAHGHALRKIQSLRRASDYDGVGVTSQEADAAIKSAELFVAAVEQLLANRTP